MTEFIKICVFSIVCSASVLIISKREKELSLVISTAIYILVMLYIISQLGSLLDSIRKYINGFNTIPNIEVLVKAGGIAILSSVGSIICESEGQKSLSYALEIFALIEVFKLCMPIAGELFLTMIKFSGE